jgi:hypothetical protein
MFKGETSVQRFRAWLARMLFSMAIALSTSAFATSLYELGRLTAPTTVSQFAYASQYHTLLMIDATNLTVMALDLNTQQVTTHATSGLGNVFTDLAVSTSGRYVYATESRDFAHNTQGDIPFIHRLDLRTGVWEVKSAFFAHHIQVVSDSQFLLTSPVLDGGLIFSSWDSGHNAVQILNNDGYLHITPGSFDPAYHFTQSGHWLRYIRTLGRMALNVTDYGSHGTGIQAFRIRDDNNFQSLESTDPTTYKYNIVPLVLATDDSALYAGALQYDPKDLTHLLRTLPENVQGATGDIAFGANTYYDAHSGDKLGSLGFVAFAFAFDPHVNDFWVTDHTHKTLYHFAPTPTPQNTTGASLSNLTLHCPGWINQGATGSCSAQAIYSDGTGQAVTPLWSSSDAANLAIDATGKFLVSANAPAETVTVIARYGEAGIARQQSATIQIRPSAYHPASIQPSTITSTSLSAIINAATEDIGKPASIWLGGVYQGQLFLRNGNAWTPYTSGSMPAALAALAVPAVADSTSINVIDQLDISSLTGLDIYAGYGLNGDASDMLNSPGKLAKIYTVPAPALKGISLQPDKVPLGTQTTIVPIPAQAALGNCYSTNYLATVSGSVATLNDQPIGRNPTIICGTAKATITVVPPPLTGIHFKNGQWVTSISVGDMADIYPLPTTALLGTCTSSNPAVADIEVAVSLNFQLLTRHDLFVNFLVDL